MKLNSNYSSSGRSPYADQIYNEYLATYQYINEKISELNLQIHDLPPGSDAQKNQLLRAIQQLVALQGNGGQGIDSLYQAYLAGYTDQISLQDFESLRQKIMQEADAIAGGGSNPSDQIKKDLDQANQLVHDLLSQLTQDQSAIDQLGQEIASWEQTIQSLQQKAAGNPQAEKDLENAISLLQSLKQQYAALNQDILSLQSSLDQAQQALSTLSSLANLPSPSQEDLQKADQLLETIQNLNGAFGQAQNTFNKDIPTSQQIDAMDAAIQAVQDDLNPQKKSIQDDYRAALEAYTAIEAKIITDLAKLHQLNDQISKWQQQIADLQQKAGNNPQAEKDLAQAMAMLTALQKQATELGQDMVALQSDVDQAKSSLDALNALKNLASPTAADQQQADALLAQIQSLSQAFTQQQSDFDLNMPSDAQVQAMNAIIETINHEITPTPPSSVPVENAAWYIDWTSWGDPNYPIPEGVDTINIFVGEITMKDGKPTMDGFGNFDAAKLSAFVQACHAKGISVKVSIGGSGGMYDKCWDQLTPENVQSFAQGMADFCHQYGIDGVDFDYEEFASPEQETLVGNLIRDFKAIDSNFQTSLCSNAGFSTWQGGVKNILDGAMDSSGHCSVDRLYIMSYYDPLSNEEGWLTQWANWLENDYHFSPSQITVGLDDFDAHAYDIEAFAKWAKEQGFSTGYWAWNPADPSQSNQSSQKIWDIYHSESHSSSLDTASYVEAAMARENALLAFDMEYYSTLSHTYKKHLQKA